MISRIIQIFHVGSIILRILQFHSVTHTTFEYWKIQRTKKSYTFQYLVTRKTDLPCYVKSKFHKVKVCPNLRPPPVTKASAGPRLHSTFENENSPPSSTTEDTRPRTTSNRRELYSAMADINFKFIRSASVWKATKYIVSVIFPPGRQKATAERGNREEGCEQLVYTVEWIAARKRGRYLGSI